MRNWRRPSLSIAPHYPGTSARRRAEPRGAAETPDDERTTRFRPASARGGWSRVAVGGYPVRCAPPARRRTPPRGEPPSDKLPQVWVDPAQVADPAQGPDPGRRAPVPELRHRGRRRGLDGAAVAADPRPLLELRRAARLRQLHELRPDEAGGRPGPRRAPVHDGPE